RCGYGLFKPSERRRHSDSRREAKIIEDRFHTLKICCPTEPSLRSQPSLVFDYIKADWDVIFAIVSLFLENGVMYNSNLSRALNSYLRRNLIPRYYTEICF